MVTQDLPLQGPLAIEVISTLRELAGLAQRAGSAPIESLGALAHTMLERLLTLCQAQSGAVLLTMPGQSGNGQFAQSAATSPRVLRTLALQNIREEDAYALLPAFSSPAPAEGQMQSPSDVSCWITSRLAIGEFMVEHHVPDFMPGHTRSPLQALLVLGWAGADEGMCAAAIERSHTLLPYIADAASAVIVSILQAERIQELETSADSGALRQMELLKAELLGTVSHELRSPLASIKGYAATLLRHERRLSREERHQFLLAINEASDRLEVIIERLLEISQLETDAVSVDLAPLDMARLARESIISVEQRLPDAGARPFTFDLLPEKADGSPAHTVPLVMGDQRRMREVLDNLLENAVKYSPEGGTVRIVLRPVTLDPMGLSLPGTQTYSVISSANAKTHAGEDEPEPGLYPPRRWLEVCVCDNGMGIPAEHLDRIFDRFHRVDTRLTREVNGLGLGLSICKRIVELHGGLIWAENRLDGKGSAFYVRLPIVEEEKKDGSSLCLREKQP